MRRAARRLAVLVVGMTIVVAGSAYLASNVVSLSSAGEGHEIVTMTVTSSTGQPTLRTTPFPLT